MSTSAEQPCAACVAERPVLARDYSLLGWDVWPSRPIKPRSWGKWSSAL